MKIAILLFEEITALDAIGPYEVLSRLPGAKLSWVGKQRGLVRSDAGLGLNVDHTLSEVSKLDMLLVPGGFGARTSQADRELLTWLRDIDATTTITASVCTGSILLGAAGLLRGRRATTHWAFYDELAAHGAQPVSERVVRDGKYASAAGVSAGIDLGLALAIELAGEEVASAIQLSIEYDPAPPLNAGNPANVSSSLRERMYKRAHLRDAEIQNASRN